MILQKIDIDGTVYTNVSNIKTEIETVNYYKVTTLDGKTHQKTRYTKTHQEVQFYNILQGDYEELKEFIKQKKDVAVNCGFPDDEDGFVYADYLLSIKEPDTNKGYLRGNYYRTGVIVRFEKVNADE